MLRNEKYTVQVQDRSGGCTDWFFDDYDDVIAMTMIEFGWAISEDQLELRPEVGLRLVVVHHSDYEWFAILTSA